MKKTNYVNGAGVGRREYPNLDVARIMMALLIVVIHTRPFANVSAAFDFVSADIVARVAVPVFYTISGFLFFGKLEYSDDKIKWSSTNRIHLLRFIRRMVFTYAAWSAVYIIFKLPFWYKIGWWGIAVIKDCVTNLFFSGSFYHLWYLLALIYAVPVLFGILLICPIRKLPVIIVVAWVFECLIYSYDWIGFRLPGILELLLNYVPIAFDSLLRALPLLGIGVQLIGCGQDERGGRNNVFAWCAFALCAAEAIALKTFSPNKTCFSYLLSTPPMAYFMVKSLLTNSQLSVPKELCVWFRDVSLLLYCLHPLVIEILDMCGMEKGILNWLAVMVISIAVSVTGVWIHKTWKGKRK